MAGKTAWKSATPQLSLVLPGVPPSQFHSTVVESGSRKPRRVGSLIRQALYLDQEDAYAAGEVGFLARALVQATLPHSDPKANEFVRRNGHFTLSILAPKDVGLPYGRYPLLVFAYLTTEAVRRKSPDIELGSHFSHFCATLGIPPTTGPRGSCRSSATSSSVSSPRPSRDPHSASPFLGRGSHQSSRFSAIRKPSPACRPWLSELCRPDELSLYYHRLGAGRFVIYRVRRAGR
jgi:hypothetical protein